LLVAALVWLASPAPTSAQEDARAQAHAHFERGVQHAAARAYARALESFQAAYRLAPHPATLYNIGLAFVALERRTEAATALRNYLRESAGEPEHKRARAQGQLERLLSLLGVVQLAIEPSSARVRVDGVPCERTQELLLAPGAHHVQVSLAGYATQERELVVGAGTTQTLALTLARSRKPSAAAPADGQLRVIVFPYGSVSIDGEARGSSPLTLSLPAGPHVIEYGAERPENAAHVTVIAGQLQEIVLRWVESTEPGTQARHPAP
jgi:hypothetical protein